MNKIKFCPKCKKKKFASEFCKCKARPDGLGSYCKVCDRAVKAIYRLVNADKIKEKARKKYIKGNKAHFYRHLKCCYGPEAPMIYDMFFVAQKERCFLCGRHQSELKSRLCLEHNHKTGEFRSLCCRRCNLIIGWAEEFGLEKLNKYLETES